MAWTICLSDADISTQTLAYTVAAGSEARLTASFTNRSTSATATATLWVVPSGETVGNEHLKESGTTLGLAGTSQAVLERSFVAPAGAKVYVQASTTNVSCQVQGDVVSPDTFGVTDGTSSITYGTNWGNLSSLTSLKKDQNGLVSLTLRAVASGSVGTLVATLPSGYRPPTSLLSLSAISLATYTGPGGLTIDTSGNVRVVLYTSLTSETLASGATVAANVSFFI